MKAKLYLICLFLFPFVSHAQLSAGLDLNDLNLSPPPDANAPAEATFEEKAGGAIKEYLTKILKLQKEFNALNGPNEFLSGGVPIIKEEHALTTRFLDDKEGELSRFVKKEINNMSSLIRRLSEPSGTNLSSEMRLRNERLAEKYEAEIGSLHNLQLVLSRLRKRMSVMQRTERENLEYLGDVHGEEALKVIAGMKIEWNNKINIQIVALAPLWNLLSAESKKQDGGKKE